MPKTQEVTELDQLLKDRAELVAFIDSNRKNRFNVWLQKEKRVLDAKIARIDEEGNLPDPQLPDEFDPGGWTDGFSNNAHPVTGAVLVQSVEETAKEWLDNPHIVASLHGGTERLYRMAAYNMKGRFLMVPPNIHPHGYTEEQLDLYIKNYEFNMRYAFASGGGKLGLPKVYTEFKTNQFGAISEGTNSVPNNFQPHAGNRPEMIAMYMADVYGDDTFKARAIATARRFAVQIDNGVRDEVPGYEKIDTLTARNKERWQAHKAPFAGLG